MPTYAYKCACGHSAEKFVRMSDYKVVLDCPECKAPEGLKKVPTAGQAPIFKGSGFYETDFKHK